MQIGGDDRQKKCYRYKYKKGVIKLLYSKNLLYLYTFFFYKGSVCVTEIIK